MVGVQRLAVLCRGEPELGIPGSVVTFWRAASGFLDLVASNRSSLGLPDIGTDKWNCSFQEGRGEVAEALRGGGERGGALTSEQGAGHDVVERLPLVVPVVTTVVVSLFLLLPSAVERPPRGHAKRPTPDDTLQPTSGPR